MHDATWLLVSALGAGANSTNSQKFQISLVGITGAVTGRTVSVLVELELELDATVELLLTICEK